jgi:hypothetical protein
MLIVLFFASSGAFIVAQHQAFGFDDLMGVVDENTARFYESRWNSESGRYEWISELTFMDFDLPNGCDGVFEFVGDWTRRTLCVVVENVVKFYEFYGNSWRKATRYIDFDLPNEYDSVFGFIYYQTLTFCVVIENTVRFYEYNGREFGWRESEDLVSFYLPNGYYNVFPFYSESTNNRIIGVVFEKALKFYIFNTCRGRWEEITNMAFDLPNGHNIVFRLSGGIGLLDGNAIKYFLFDQQNKKWYEFFSDGR